MSKFSGQFVQVSGSFTLPTLDSNETEAISAVLADAQAQARQIIASAQAQARQMLEGANEQARALVAEGEAQKEATLQQAYAEGQETGYAQGYESGLAQAEQETVQLLQSAQTILDAAYQSKELILKGFRKEAGQIISYVTGKILRTTFDADPALMVEMVEGAIRSLHLTGRVRVVISPEALERIRNFSTRTDDTLELLDRMEFIADPSLELTEIFVLSQDGNFSLTPARQIERLVAPLVKHLPINEVVTHEVEDESPLAEPPVDIAELQAASHSELATVVPDVIPEIPIVEYPDPAEPVAEALPVAPEAVANEPAAEHDIDLETLLAEAEGRVDNDALAAAAPPQPEAVKWMPPSVFASPEEAAAEAEGFQPFDLGLPPSEGEPPA